MLEVLVTVILSLRQFLILATSLVSLVIGLTPRPVDARLPGASR
jgi:hypothetical protein